MRMFTSYLSAMSIIQSYLARRVVNKTRSRFFLHAVFFFVALWTSSLAQSPLPHIAVIDFSGDESITPQQLQFISGELASELTKTQAFVVLERGRMGTILQEQGFQQSGICNSNECQVQIGQLLGVDNLVAGSLVRFGPKYAFRIEYLDVSTGRILQTISFEKKGELHEVYRSATQEAAQSLASFVQAPLQTTPEVLPEPETPRLDAGVVSTSPQGGRSWKLPVALGLAAGGLVCGVLGYLANTELGDERASYDSLENPTLEQADSQWDNVQSSENRRNLLYGLGAGLLATGITVQLAF